MSTTLTSEPSSAPRGTGDRQRRARSRTARTAWLVLLGVVIVGAVVVGSVLLAWMVDETHFDRPSAEFDEFATQVEALPGVQALETERWVEAPTFADPTSFMAVTLSEEALPGLIDAACSTEYPDPITWSIRVRTPAAAEVLLHAGPPHAGAAGVDSRCPDFGFDAAAVVAELDSVAPGIRVQPAMWEEGELVFVALEDTMPMGYGHMLPIVEHAGALRAAAGLDEGDIEINSANLGVVVEPGKSDAYLRLLTVLAQEHGVTSFWADGGTPTDGVVKVQVVAPDAQHATIEEAIRSSGLRLADLPVRFVDQ